MKTPSGSRANRVGWQRTARGGMLPARFRRGWMLPMAHRAAPAEYRLRTDLPPPRNLGHTCPWGQGLRDDPCLLIRRPAPPPTRSRENLNAPEFALRVIVNVKHKDSSKPSASSKSSTSAEAIKHGLQRPAYVQGTDRSIDGPGAHHHHRCRLLSVPAPQH